MLDDYFDDLNREQHAKRVKLREAVFKPANANDELSIDRSTLGGQLYSGDSAAADLLFGDDDDDYDF